MSKNRIHVTLIGASIGEAWNLAGWATRIHAPEYSANSVAVWQFDKSEAVQEVLLRPRLRFRPTRTYLKALFGPSPIKPDIVILKECSSYFPGNFERYRNSVCDWLQRIEAHKVLAMPATVVPVTRTRAAADAGKQEGLVAFNHWIREYAQEQKLPLLDLEAALNDKTEGSYLREEYAARDGSHLNAKAYHVLDGSLKDILCSLK